MRRAIRDRLVEQGCPSAPVRDLEILLGTWLAALALYGSRLAISRRNILLLFELAWKAIWLSVVAAPKWASGAMDKAALETTFACLLVVVFLPVIPWRRVAATFFSGPGDRWR